MSRFRPWLAPLAVFSVGFFFFHRQEVLSLWDQMPGDRGDPRFVGFLLEHWHQALRGTFHVLSPPIFYPVKETLRYTHALVGYLPLYLPWRWLGIDPWSSQQLAFALVEILNFASALWLLGTVMGVERKLALFFAAFVSFNSAKFNFIGHPQLQLLFYLIVATGLVAKAMKEAPDRSRLSIWAMLGAAAILLDLQLLTDVYNAWFLCLWAGLWGLLSLSRAETRAWIVQHRQKLTLPAAGALLVLGLGLVPFLRLYLPAMRLFGGWKYDGLLDMIPRWYSFFSMGDGNWLWGWLPVPRGYAFSWEHHIGLGFAIYLLTCIVLFSWRSLPWVARSCLFATVLFVMIAFRYGDTKSPWQLVHAIIPGAQSLRAIARYVIVLTIPLAIALGLALTARMGGWSAWKNRAVWALLLLAALEQLGTGKSFSKSKERAYLEGLRSQIPDRCEAFYTAAPAGRSTEVLANAVDAMWLALLRGIPAVNGYSGHYPNGWYLFDTTDPEYQLRVSRWVSQNRIQGAVCRVEVDQ
jgi:hypothetical protein